MDKYYQILGISPNASEDEVKSAYRKLAKQYHPDVNNGDDTKFKEVKEAYEIIAGKSRPPRSEQQPWEPIDPNNFGFGFGFDFSDFFGNQQQESLPTEENAVITMNIPIRDIINGINYSINYKVAEDCKDCNSVGGESVSQCARCRGSGHIGYRQGHMVFSTGCNECRGKGKIIKNPCQKCSGNGKIVVSKHLDFEIRKKQ